MQIPFEILVLIASPIGTTLIAAMLVTDDLIIRDVCRRQGKKYSILWPLSSYRHWRIFKLSWFGKAKEASYLE